MKTIEYLNLLGNEYLKRARQELGLECSILFGENEDGGWAEVLDGEGRGVTLQMAFPLMAEDEWTYVPRVTEEEWDLFLREVKPWRFEDESVH